MPPHPSSPQSLVGENPRGKPSDVRVVAAELYFLPIETRVPLKFGKETLSSVTCARARLVVVGRDGQMADGWGEVPLSAQWAWPHDSMPVVARVESMMRCCELLAHAWVLNTELGHALEIGDDFNRVTLPALMGRLNRFSPEDEQLPYLAALICNSAFDIALHDAYGNKQGLPVYDTYGPEFMNRDLSAFISPSKDSNYDFAGMYPRDFLENSPAETLPVWHLVGGLDALTQEEGGELIDAGDDLPVTLTAWIDRDGIDCLKIKLRGDDDQWDYDRLVGVGKVADDKGVSHLTADFNCMVADPSYVINILNRLSSEHPGTFDKILYVEQPFPYDLDAYPIDVSELAKVKPLLMDESAHDWRCVKQGRELGWNGVALKTCKTQSGALLSLCWAKAHNMHIMVQDLTNPMLAQVPHVQLAAHAQTMHGVESNAMQFYPKASVPESKVHPGLYRRRDGVLQLASLAGSGFGYRVSEIKRQLPQPAVVASA